MDLRVTGIARTMVDGLDFPFSVSAIILIGSRNVVHCHLSSEYSVIVPSRAEPLHARSCLLSRAFCVHNSSVVIRGWYSKAWPPFPGGMNERALHSRSPWDPLQHLPWLYQSVTPPFAVLLQSRCFSDGLDALPKGSRGTVYLAPLDQSLDHVSRSWKAS